MVMKDFEFFRGWTVPENGHLSYNILPLRELYLNLS